jgi:energy-coupling factor transport system permease protein
MSGVLSGVHAAEPAIPAVRPGDAWAPLLLAGVLAALIASRAELVALSLLLAVVAGWRLGAPAPRPAWMRMVAIGALIAMIANALLVRGTALPPRLPFGLNVSREGLAMGAMLALRLIAVAMGMRALAAAWPGERAADEVAGRLGPLTRLGVPVDEWRAVLGLALRFVPMVRAEGERIARVQALRAGAPARGPLERLTRLRAAVVPTLVASLERAEWVSLALEARHHRIRASRVAPWPRAAITGGVALLAAACLWRR